MASKKYATLDEYDSRIALYSDEAFQYGITFNAKVMVFYYDNLLW